MKKSLIFFVFLSFIATSFIFSQSNEFLSIKSFADKDVYKSSDTIKVALEVDINKIYHIQSNKPLDESYIPTTVNLATNDFKLLEAYYPQDKEFKMMGETIKVYSGKIFIGLKLLSVQVNDGLKDLKINLNFQPCDDKICKPPTSVESLLKLKFDSLAAESKLINSDIFANINFNVPVSSDLKTETAKQDSSQVSSSEDNNVSDILESNGLFVGLLLIFLGGLALNLTPCVYPLIPITISYFGAQASGSRLQSIFMGIFYALGMSITYSALGLFAAFTGSLFGTALQSPIVVIIISLVFIALALSMFGLYEIRVPQKLAVAGNKNRKGFFGSMIMGLLVGIIAAPCIGPFVLSLLVYVGKIGNPLYGFLLFFILSMGLGFPYIILAAFSSSLNKLPRSGEWMMGVKVIFGFLLIGLALNTILPLFPQKAAAIIFPVFLILAGAYLILIDKKGLSSKGYTKIKYVIAILAILWGGWSLKPNESSYEVTWKNVTTLEEFKSQSKMSNLPVMVDFYADWCAQCKELDKITYVDKDVAELSKSFNCIKVDLTKGDKQIEDLFEIKGLPVVAFLKPNGEEIKTIRVTGFLKPKEFLQKMKTALK